MRQKRGKLVPHAALELTIVLPERIRTRSHQDDRLNVATDAPHRSHVKIESGIASPGNDTITSQRVRSQRAANRRASTVKNVATVASAPDNVGMKNGVGDVVCRYVNRYVNPAVIMVGRAT